MKTRANRRWGFTLTELMVAVAILVIVVLATGKIFGTASTVSGMGIATENVLQDAAAIERRLRDDFARLSREGVFAIQSHVLENDIYDPVLLNPALARTIVDPGTGAVRPPAVRCDQLLFFTTGVDGIQTFAQGWGSNRKGQSTAARVYYGHAFQLPGARGFDAAANRAHDLAPSEQITPWYSSAVDGFVPMAWTTMESSGAPSFTSAPSPSIDATQPEARRWILARQPVILADDWGAENTLFLTNNVSARTLYTFEPQVRDGRVDAAATNLADIRNFVTSNVDNGTVAWTIPWLPGQRNVIGNQLVYFPRAETFAPSAHRVDQALTNTVLSSACSSFIVEWTYDQGVGFADNPSGGPDYRGVRHDGTRETPWFGAPDPDRPGVQTYRDWAASYAPGDEFGGADTVAPEWIDETFVHPDDDHLVYRAFFGLNASASLDPATGEPWDVNSPYAYTPWPSAVRITMVLHDPQTRLENGRRFQFVIRLPER